MWTYIAAFFPLWLVLGVIGLFAGKIRHTWDALKIWKANNQRPRYTLLDNSKPYKGEDWP